MGWAEVANFLRKSRKALHSDFRSCSFPRPPCSRATGRVFQLTLEVEAQCKSGCISRMSLEMLPK